MEHECPFIILLSGTPGTGKTTIAKELCERYGWKSFAVGKFVIENEYYVTENKEKNIKTIDVDKVSCLGAREILTNYMDSSVVIVDSHYADIIMDGFLDSDEGEYSCISIYTKEVNIAGIVLRCHPKILQNRLEKRDYSHSKIMENLQAEILSESTNNLLEVLSEDHVMEINSGIRSFSEVSATIFNWYSHKLENKAHKEDLLQNIGEIDWITELNKDGTLDSYFKQDFGNKTILKIDNLRDEKS
jgi:adenylate kinase